MKVGDYVRTVGGLIGKVIEIEGNAKTYEIPNRQENDVIEIIKSSPNIIDLIKVGDYVNGVIVTQSYIDNINHIAPEIKENNYGIKTIVTKEQFSQMEYRIRRVII